MTFASTHSICDGCRSREGSIADLKNEIIDLRAALNDAQAEAAERGEWTGKPCSSCKGTGEDVDARPCASCAGTGDEWLSWKERAKKAETALNGPTFGGEPVHRDRYPALHAALATTPPLRFIEECTPGGTILSRKLQYQIDGQWVTVPVVRVEV